MLDPDAPQDLDRLERFDRGNSAIPDAALNTEDISSFIPPYHKPDRPCEYCAARQLECKVFQINGNRACLSCNALFRPCSFISGPKRQHNLAFGQIDTLHVVEEDVPFDQGKQTGNRWLSSAGADLTMTMPGPVNFTEEITQEKSGGGRFSRAIVHTLKRWIDEHSSNPYPTEEEKEHLKEQTGLSRSQISNWLANARRRGKGKASRRGRSPGAQPESKSPVASGSSCQPMAIPEGYQPADQSHLTPFERWKDSPPDHEPCTVGAISRALANTGFSNHDSHASSSASHSMAEHHRSSTDDSSFSRFRAPSSTSIESGKSSGSGSKSMWSHGSSRGSYGSFAKKDRRHRRRSTPMPSRSVVTGKQKKHETPRPYHCTFCADAFQTKYDWQRHEKSLHLNLEKWTCCPDGPIIPAPPAQRTASGTICAYCTCPDPDAIHLMEAHDHDTCAEKGLAGRTFHRKDHLRQHVRLVHSTPNLLPHMEAWKQMPAVIRSRCGFCDERFTSWEERNTHLSGHFREGKSMADWHGDWGLDPEVVGHVRDAIQPYMIHNEAISPMPFSAQKDETWRYELARLRDVVQTGNDIGEAQPGNPAPSSLQSPRSLAGLVSPAASTGGAQNRGLNAESLNWPGNPDSPLWIHDGWGGLLAIALTQYVDRARGEGQTVTDKMIRDHARYLMYDSTDEWNFSEADSDEWLKAFKEHIGMS